MKKENKIIPGILNTKKDESFPDKNYNVILCPVCGSDFIHIADQSITPGNDNYDAVNEEWSGRGSLLRTSFWGECGHFWDLFLGFHKGRTLCYLKIADTFDHSKDIGR